MADAAAPMRVTYIGYDFFSPVLLSLVHRTDVQIVRVVSDDQPWGEHVCHIARQHGLPLVLERARKADLAAFAGDSDLVLCAAYDYRLVIPEGTACRFLNLHPTLLPVGRGPAPVQWTLTSEQHGAGVTLHAMNAAYDAGPIVSQIPVSAGDGVFETYLHRANQAAIGLVAALDRDSLRTLASRPQDGTGGTYNPIMPESRRSITPGQTGAEIERLVAAMGPMGAAVTIGGVRYLTTRVTAVRCDPTADEAYVNWFYGYYPCADGYCLFHRAALQAVVLG